jgi:hypothetical protein
MAGPTLCGLQVHLAGASTTARAAARVSSVSAPRTAYRTHSVAVHALRNLRTCV